jgi:segregation and condensation protein A
VLVLTEDYRVHLDAFEGPLDLLLFLIRKNEVDIHDIPVAVIAEQYLAFLKGIEGGLGKIDIDTAGEFLVTAATLLEIKSRMLSPSPAAQTTDAAGPEEDPRADLVRQLLAYKKYRDAAEALEKRGEEWRRRFPAGAAGVDEQRLQEAIAGAIEGAGEGVDAEDLDLMDLVEAFQRISETVNFDRLGEHHVQYDDTPVELHAEDIVDQLRRLGEAEREARGEMSFAGIFRGRTKGEMVGLFLALLQLVRLRRVAIRQEREGREPQIFVSLREEELPEGGTPPEAQASGSGR